MQTITLKTHVDPNGVVRLEIPTDLADREVEIIVIMQPFNSEPHDAMGYPIGYFENTYGSFAHEPLERNQPTQVDTCSIKR